MAYIKTRTRGGSISTALVEAYRDPQGRPRQRVLANLHGESDLLSALAKLAARRAALQEEKGQLAAEAVHANEFHEIVTLRGDLQEDNDPEIFLVGPDTLPSKTVAPATIERKEVGRLMRLRDRLLARMKQVDADLVVIQKDGIAIKQHCTATPDQIQNAIKAFKQKASDAEALVLGTEFCMRLRTAEAKAQLRRLQSVTRSRVREPSPVGSAGNRGSS